MDTLRLSSAVGVLGLRGALNDDKAALHERQEATRRMAQEQAEAVPAIADAGWRELLPGVTKELRPAADLSRQEGRALQRRIARITASQAKTNARSVARQERKARRAGLRSRVVA